jgi:putative aldouronate transport system permease protein
MRKKLYKSDKLFDVVNYSLMTFAFVIVLYPLIYTLSCSFSSPETVMANKVWLFPVDIAFDGYKAVFSSSKIWMGYANTIFYTAVGTLVNIVVTIMAGYPLSRKDFYGRNVIMFIFTFTMFFNGGLIPTFLLVRDLGLYNSRLALILPSAMAMWHVIITRTYFQSNIADSLLESAQIEGCSDIRFILKVVVPLSKPIIAVISLYYGIMHWNEFFNAMIYLRDSQLYPLQLILREILIQNSSDTTMTMDLESAAKKELLAETLKYALIVVSTVPVLVVYPFVQKFFVKGIMVGSLKG